MASDRWSHWGNDRGIMQSVDYPIHDRVLNIQRIVLNHLLDPAVLARKVQSEQFALKADKDDKQALTVAEIFRSLTDSVWSDTATTEKEGKKTLTSSIIPGGICNVNIFEICPASCWVHVRPVHRRTRAEVWRRMHLREIGKRVDKLLTDKQLVLDDTTRAHLEECQERISKILNASMQANEP